MKTLLTAYSSYGDLNKDLAFKISEIAKELKVLNSLVRHGQTVLPANRLSLDDYKRLITHQIQALTALIQAPGLDTEHADISEHLAQFNQNAMELIDRLDHLETFPDLANEEWKLRELIGQFDGIVEDLGQNPPRKEALHAMNQCSALLEETHQLLVEVRSNPAVQIAQVVTEGVVAAEGLYPEAPSPRPIR